MDWARTSKYAGAGAALVLLTAWMVPPTTPKPPAEATWRATAKAQQESAVQVANAAPAGLPASIGQPLYPAGGPAYHASATAPVVVHRPMRAPRLASEDDAAATEDDVVAPEPIVIRHRDAGADSEQSAALRYRSGYAWASSMRVQDARDCRRWRGDAGEDGCIDYLRDQDRGHGRDDRRDDDRDDERPDNDW